MLKALPFQFFSKFTQANLLSDWFNQRHTVLGTKIVLDASLRELSN